MDSRQAGGFFASSRLIQIRPSALLQLPHFVLIVHDEHDHGQQVGEDNPVRFSGHATTHEPPHNEATLKSGTYARARRRTMMYSTRNHAATNSGICKVDAVVAVLAAFIQSSAPRAISSQVESI
jgi:hypothetical protein